MSQIVKPTKPIDVRVSYVCQHLTCRNAACYKSKLNLSKQTFDSLYESEKEKNIFRSPSGYCKLGTHQLFEIVDIEQLANLGSSPKDKLLKLENELSLKKAELLQAQTSYQKTVDKLNEQIKILNGDIKRVRVLLQAETIKKV